MWVLTGELVARTPALHPANQCNPTITMMGALQAARGCAVPRLFNVPFRSLSVCRCASREASCYKLIGKDIRALFDLQPFRA